MQVSDVLQPGTTPDRTAFLVQGMDCAEETTALRSVLTPLDGVFGVDFEVLRGRMIVTHDPRRISVAAIRAAVRRTGMSAEPWKSTAGEGSPRQVQQRIRQAASTATSGAALLAGFAVHVLLIGWRAALGGHENVSVPAGAAALYAVAMVSGVWLVIPKAWSALRRGRPDMNLLMTAAVVGAILIGELFEAATVSFLFAFSLTLESWSVARARQAIAALMELSPDLAHVVGTGDRETDLPVSEVPVGSRIIVKPGEKFPLDGRIVAGETTVNQSPITGESTPVAKSPGSDVFAGTINEEGAVEMVSSKPAGETTLARIIQLVGEAQGKRSPSEQWVERFSTYYTPLVMALAVAVMTIPPLASVGSWSHWFYQGLVLLVIACPCALVISTPVSVVAGMTAAARRGVLIKGGSYLEAPAHLKAIALDKTGTLTEGRPEVCRIIALSGHTEDEVLQIAMAIELRSDHPLARAMVSAAQRRGLAAKPVDGFRAMPGKGAEAMLAGRPVWLGSHRFLEDRGQETPELHTLLESLAQEGTSTIVVGEDEHVCGIVAMQDAVRPNARAAIEDLRSAGVQQVVMLTGDNRAAAEDVAQHTGVTEVQAGLLPEEKVAAIEELIRRYGQVAMIGDGVNDAPAMARASLGIAMGVAGSDAALETADIALMSDDLSKVAWLVLHARRVLWIIRQNIVLSLGVKAAFVMLTLFGHASLWAAIAADMGASLLVILNGLRLLKAGVIPAGRD